MFNKHTETGLAESEGPVTEACLSLPLTCCLLLQERYLVGSRTHMLLSAATFSQSKQAGSSIIHNCGKEGPGGRSRS